jgi:hypothetical protein
MEAHHLVLREPAMADIAGDHNNVMFVQGNRDNVLPSGRYYIPFHATRAHVVFV